MAEETIRNDRVADGAHPAHTTTIIREGRSSGGTGIVMAVVLLIAVVGGLYLFSQSSSSEVARDNAIAEAAGDVGAAAGQIGDAAENAADGAATN